MLRLFSHYVSAKLLLLIALDSLILGGSIDWAFSYHLQALAEPLSPTVYAASAAVELLFVVIMLIVMSGMGLYEPDIVQHVRSAVLRLAIAGAVGGAATVLVMAIVSPSFVPLRAISAGSVLALVSSGALRWVLSRWAALGSFKPRVLVLGNGGGAAKLAELAQRHRNQEVVGYVECGAVPTERVPLPRLLPASGESLAALAEKYAIDHIVVAVKDRRGGALPVTDLLDCRLRGVRVNDLSTFFEREHRQVLLESLTPGWMVFGDGFRQGLVRTMVKRLFDIGVSMALMILTLPIMALAALCIVAESGRPFLYRQERVGEGGRTFYIYKFRSMRIEAERDGTPRWAGANDDRITRVGRLIRKTRIDELPQVFNVLKGEMSFVGPRPERPYFVDRLAEQIPYYGLRHSVKPGITGWAQVSYTYGASVEDAIEKLQYDLYYVKNHTLFLDLVILAATIEVVLWGSGSGAQPAPPVTAAVHLKSRTVQAK